MMKHRIKRGTALLLALLMLGTTALASCNKDGGSGATTDPEAATTTQEDTAEDASSADADTEAGTSSEDATGEGTSADTTPEGDDPSDSTPAETDPTDPPVDTKPEVPEHLIGDGSPNVEVYPTFSAAGGIYTTRSKTVEITAPEGYTVRYTTDGSIPTKRSTEYKDAIKITVSRGEGMTIRAACFDKKGNLVGQVITNTYVSAASETGLHYTVMLTCDEDDLNDMYADPQEKIERAAHAEIIAPDGTRIISQDVGLRLFGGSSRGLRQKSFKIVARKDGYFGENTPYVGLGTFTYPFFPERTVIAGKNAGKVLTKYDGLVLRNGGNDSLLATAADPDRPNMLRDGMANEFIAKFAPNVQMSYAHFAVVYLNGEYYGILELRENQNEDYIKRLYGVDDADVVVVKSELDTTRACENHDNGGGCRFCGSWFFYETDEDAAAQKEMKDWIALCKKAAGAVNASEAEYRKVFVEVESKLDLRNALEYMACACYLVNTDWPHNNIRVWRYTGEAVDGISITDGKWRFATRDMDFTMARYDKGANLPEIETTHTVDMFSWVLSNYVSGYGDQQQYTDALYLQGLFSFLMRDDTFRADFAEFCRTLASDEATAYLKALYTDAYAQVDPIVGAHITRWENQTNNMLSDARAWRKAAQRVEKFIEARPAQFLKHLDKMLSMYD
ncbi:MAG: CotH kinase family protein [Clostridia bacterium]|nr:CotH kinase family protein [Clostridia bacterium]